jgi:transposase-like protein
VKSMTASTAFVDSPLEGGWPYLWLDATYLKVRDDSRIVSVAVTMTFWTGLLRRLARRGLHRVSLSCRMRVWASRPRSQRFWASCGSVAACT